MQESVEEKPQTIPLLLPPSYLEGLNDEQAQAVLAPREAGVQVLAGAGTGKTELIARRFVRLMEALEADGIAAPEERILVVTFTDAAAASMRERIHRRVGQRWPERQTLSPQTCIATFHQFCSRLLRSHALSAGQTPDFTILDALEQRVLFRRLLTGVLSGHYGELSAVLAAHHLEALPPDILSLDSLRQLGEGRDLGAVEVLLERLPAVIARIKAAGQSPAEFRQTAWQQSQALTEALKTLPLREPYSGEPLEDFESYVHAWKRHLQPWASPRWDPLDPERVGLEPKAADYKKQVAFLYDCKQYLRYVKKVYVPVDNPDFSPLDAATAQEARLTDVIAALYALYQETLRTKHLCDFDDLINQCITLLAGSEALRQHYQERFQAVIVDEFQDSNGSQLRLLQLLTGEADTPRLTVVGDEKQSIYGFRFAQPENLHLVFQNRAHEPITLRANYRSQPPILSVANHLTRRLVGSDAQGLASGLPQGEEAPPAVQWITLGKTVYVPNLQGEVKEKDEPMDTLQGREAQWIADETARLVASGAARYGDVAVLVKSHRKAQRIQDALAARGIPVIRASQAGFFQEPAIKDAMAVLRLMLNLKHDAALVRLLQSRLSHRQLRVLCQARRDGAFPSLFDLLATWTADTASPVWPEDFSPAVREALASLVVALKTAKALRLSPLRLFLHCGETIGYLPPEASPLAAQQARIHLRVFEKLLARLSAPEPLRPTLAEILAVLDDYQADGKADLPDATENHGEDAVRVMTIHRAKGLEFPVVFVAWTEADRPPRSADSTLLFDPQYEGKAGFGLILGRYRDDDTLKKAVYQNIWLKPRELAEQQRLFYVALTRAQQRLYVLRGKQSPAWTAPEHFTDGHPDTPFIALFEELKEELDEASAPLFV